MYYNRNIYKWHYSSYYMKLKVYKYRTTVLRIPTGIVNDLNLTNTKQNVQINKVPFKASINYKTWVNKDGTISREGYLTIPHHISQYLELKGGQEVEFEIKWKK